MRFSFGMNSNINIKQFYRRFPFMYNLIWSSACLGTGPSTMCLMFCFSSRAFANRKSLRAPRWGHGEKREEEKKERKRAGSVKGGEQRGARNNTGETGGGQVTEDTLPNTTSHRCRLLPVFSSPIILYRGPWLILEFCSYCSTYLNFRLIGTHILYISIYVTAVH